MRSMAFVGVVLLIVAPAFAGPLLYTFNATGGAITLNVQGQGSTYSPVTGTFAATVSQNGGHLGASDTFILEDAALSNTALMRLSIAGLIRCTIRPGNARFLDFAPAAPVHIPGNNLATTVNTDVYVEATVMVTSLMNTTWVTHTWASSLIPFQVRFSTSASNSGTINAALSGTYLYRIGAPDVSMTLTADLILNIQGTAHAIPDPSLGGLTALGLGVAGVWLRRRRG